MCNFAASLGSSKYEGCDVTIRNMRLVKKMKSSQVTPSPESTVTLSQKPSDSGVSVTMDVTSDWGQGAVGNITITNNSGKDMTEGWTLDFDLNREITNLWNATLVSSKDGHYIVKNPDWMQTLKAGESYTIGFQMGAGESCKIICIYHRLLEM